MVRTVAIVQARMGSTRLPGKALADIGGATALARVVERLRRSELLQTIVVATTSVREDDAIIEECKRLGAPCFRGSETDVLDRYYQAAMCHKAAAVVRITADCPVIDPELLDEVVRKFRSTGADYASNGIERSYPRGLDVEVFSVEALSAAWQAATVPYQREHVTPYFYENPERFRIESLAAPSDYSAYRWTLDTPEDLQLLRKIYDGFGNRGLFTWREIIQLMEREPELCSLNSHILQKSLQ